MHLDLSDDEAACLKAHLREVVDYDRFPLSPKIRTLKAILAKLNPKPDPEDPEVVPSTADRYSPPVRKRKPRK
jgi:hypothetical protein